jgi:uncharacterized paraquat-inducible protein A
VSHPSGIAWAAFALHERENAMNESERFRPSAMRCPVCSQTWLVAGARRGEAYLCKRCGTRLLAGAPAPLPNLRRGGASAKARGEARGGV